MCHIPVVHLQQRNITLTVVRMAGNLLVVDLAVQQILRSPWGQHSLCVAVYHIDVIIFISFAD